jgi:hypothetical protein
MTKSITVTATWRSSHTFEVPDDADTRNVGQLDQLMTLIQLDPDGEGDITSEIAELVDWDVH